MMMKADLITLHSVYNYGSALQTYATQKIFQKHGVDITVIDYVRPNNTFINKLKGNAKNSIIKEMIILPSLIKQKIVFDKFCKKYLKLTNKKYTNESDFDNYKLNSDFYITGSDQVWNSTWNGGIINPLYLSFAKNKCKVAFAASFGKEKIDSKEVELTKKFIEDYELISVRENSALDILKEQYLYKNAIQILDPTLLITKEEWLELSDKKFKKKNYILIYQLNSNKKFDDYAKRVAKENNCELVRICRRFDQVILNGKSMMIPTVEKFISLFNNASMVITDSFHALSFSLNLNTPFMCIYPDKFSTRLQSCLEMFDLLDRKVVDYNKTDIFKEQIDWNEINSKLNCEREIAKEYIEKCKKVATEFNK